ncbi:MAG: hypothetical protein AB4290_12015 [Spirulina sp.]
MTRFIHDQFAKQYLSELLSPLGTVETSKDIHPEGRQIDVLFTPSSPDPEHRENLGLLGRLTATPALFEPFRNPITQSDIRTCMMKLFVVLAELERKENRTKIPVGDREVPQLWILTPTASPNFLKSFSAVPSSKKDERGIYYLSASWNTAIVVIHQLPQTSETLWLRLLGRGNVQKQAVRELESLPAENPLRESVIKLVRVLIALLTKRQNKEQDLDRDDEELIMTLMEMYEEAMAELRQQAKKEFLQQGFQQGKEEGLQQGKEEGLQQGLQQGKAEGRGEGKLEATRRLIENIFQVRFGEMNDELAAIIEPIMRLSSEEFTPLLLQLSREELIDRFQENKEKE